MFDARQSNMQDVTTYAPVRIALLGILRVIFGLIVAVPAGLLIWIGPNGEAGATRAPGDMPAWWMFLIGLVLAFVAFCIVTGGVGRMVRQERLATRAICRRGGCFLSAWCWALPPSRLPPAAWDAW